MIKTKTTKTWVDITDKCETFGTDTFGSFSVYKNEKAQLLLVRITITPTTTHENNLGFTIPQGMSFNFPFQQHGSLINNNGNSKNIYATKNWDTRRDCYIHIYDVAHTFGTFLLAYE